MTVTGTAIQLNQQNLAEIGRRVPVPEYDRAAVRVGIVHFGVGGFHRAHQAMYTDRLLAEGETDWGVCGVGVMPADRRMADVLRQQDCLYTLVLKDPDGSLSASVIGSIVDYRYAPEDPEGVLELLANPQTRIVSLTVTEGGYNIHHVTGEFNAENQEVLADLAPGAVPATTFGLITEGLVRRRQRGVPPFTVMSCDNIQGNGHNAARVFTAFARLRDPELGDWVAQNVHFPNCMVDRITPVTTDADRRLIEERFGIVDGWPVVCEPFTQWVLEDDFPLGRPAWERVGVQLVQDVKPYELMKLRLINVGHQALCYFAYLAGYRLVHDAAQDPLFADFLLAYMRQEGAPTLPPLPRIDLDEFEQTVIERFSNAGVRDTVVRLCAESSDRIPKWLLPVVRENLNAGRPVALSAAIVASWARYAEGTDEQGEPINLVDRMTDELTAIARTQHDDPLAFVANREVFGDLVDEPRFTEPYLRTLDSLHHRGARATLQAIMDRPSTG